MTDIVAYAKRAKEAFRNYIDSGDANSDLCHKIYDDISHIESLDGESKRELDLFINNNTLNEISLSVGLDSDSFSRFYRKMLPVKLSRRNKRVYKVKGNFDLFIADDPAPITVKVKTYAKKSA